MSEPSAPSSPRRLALPSSTSVASARAQLLAAGQALALVTHRGAEVGVVSLDELEVGSDEDDEPISDVVSRELVRIEPWAEGRRTVVAYREASWASLRRRRPGRPRAGARWRGARPQS